MNNTCSRTNYSPAFKEGKGRTFYSFTSNKTVPLPLITKMTFPSQREEIPNDKLKEKIISMKKELNKKNFELHELKLAHNKLENEKEENLKILDNVVIESKTTGKPIEINRSKSVKEMTIAVNSYNKLKEANSISNLKRQIALYQKMIKEKETEMKSLENESKVVKLIEKNNLLLNTVDKISTISNSCVMMEREIKEKEIKAKEDTSTRDYYKALNLNLKSDNELLHEKYNERRDEQNKHITIISQHQEKFNSLKFQTNTVKQQDMQRDKEIASMTAKKDSVSDIKNDIEKTKEKIEKMNQVIKEAKEENENLSKKTKQVQNANDDYLKRINLKEKEKRRSKANENAKKEKMKKEITSLDKDINDIKKENEEIQRKLTEAQKEIEKKDKRYLDYIKEKSEEYDIVDNLNFEFTMKTKPKNEFVIQSMPDLVTVEGNMVKGDGLETVGNKEDLNKDEEEKKEEAKIELVNDDEPTSK